MNLAQQQQISFEMQKRLAETESVQSQLLKELRELKGQKEAMPGVPEGTAERHEFIPANGFSGNDPNAPMDAMSLKTADLFGTPSMRSQVHVFR